MTTAGYVNIVLGAIAAGAVCWWNGEYAPGLFCFLWLLYIGYGFAFDAFDERWLRPWVERRVRPSIERSVDRWLS